MTQQSHSSPMSITQLCNSEDKPIVTANGVDENDPDVQLAVEALGDMAKVTLPPLMTHQQQQQQHPSAPSTTPSSPLPTPTTSSLSNSRFSFSSDSSITTQDDEQYPPRAFMNRMSDLPLVNSALRAYESGNGAIKYSVDMVGSFADKFGNSSSRRGSSASSVEEASEDEAALAAASALARASLSDNNEGFRRRRPDEDARDDKLHKKRPTSRSTSPLRPYALAPKSASGPRHHHHAHASLPRSRWQQLMVHAGSAAGTTAAVISEESMKCLRYCLSWLQYAIRHIERQMDIVRNYLVSLASSKDTKTVSTTTSSSTLSNVKKEIVDTLRKVVEVVSRYAGSGLPEQAKASVRRFILALPGRWATIQTSTTASPASSPALGPHVQPHAQETSIKLLTFGDESIEMLRSVSGVFSDTIDRAELWIHRLRVVGVAGPSARRRPQKNVAASSSSSPPPSSSGSNSPQHEQDKDVMMDTSS